MKDKLYNNADSFAMAFDEEWEKTSCDDKVLKIKKIINNLSDHPFVISNKDLAYEIANFRIKTLGKYD